MSQLESIYDKKYECIYCKKPFISKKIRSRFIKINDYDTDLCPQYDSEESNPLLYHIHVCPFCGFSFSDDFSNYFPPGTKEEVHNSVESRWVPHNFSGKRTVNQAIQTYKLAIYCGELKKEKHVILAGMNMRIAWLCRSLQNDDQEQRFLGLAVKEYEESYYVGDFHGTQVSEVRILYLIGELSRRLLDTQKAVQYFSKVIEKQKQTTEPKIIDMARERWREIRENN